MTSPSTASTAGSIASSEPPVVRMSSTSSTRSPWPISKPRRNSRRLEPSSARTSSAKIARVPSWRPVSKARMTPPVVGPATRSTFEAPSSPRCVAAQNSHSSLVAAGSWSTWNFSRYASEWRPLWRMKWPSRSAPLDRNSASVRSAIARRAASWRGRRRVVMAADSIRARPDTPCRARWPSVAVGHYDVVSARPSLEEAADLDVDRPLLFAGADPDVHVAVRPTGLGGIGRHLHPGAPRLGGPALRERLAVRVAHVLVGHEGIERQAQRMAQMKVRDPALVAREPGPEADLVARQLDARPTERGPRALLVSSHAKPRVVVEPGAGRVAAQSRTRPIDRDR